MEWPSARHRFRAKSAFGATIGKYIRWMAIIASPPPPLYKVLLLNDDFTPMDFVIQVLERFFRMDREQATRVMLKVHNEGAGLAGMSIPAMSRKPRFIRSRIMPAKTSTRCSA
jgi:hypothetical protein